MSARDGVIKAIKDFNWGNYSLDEVEMGLADYPDNQEWVPALADKILAALDAQPFHVIEFKETGWTLKHPIDCRDQLFECPTNEAAQRLDGPPAELGRFEVSHNNGHLIVGKRVGA